MSELDKAKAALLRVLEQLDRAVEDLGVQPDRVDLVVVYDLGYDAGEEGWHDVGGWVATPSPSWAQESLLRHAARVHRSAMYAVDDDEPPLEGEDELGDEDDED